LTKVRTELTEFMSGCGYSVVMTGLLADLNFIAQVPPNHKLVVGPPRGYAKIGCFFDWALRKFVYWEDAKTTAEFVRKKCEMAVQELPKYTKTPVYGILFDEIRAAVKGILQLSRSYEKDPIMKGHLKHSLGLLYQLKGVQGEPDLPDPPMTVYVEHQEQFLLPVLSPGARGQECPL